MTCVLRRTAGARLFIVYLAGYILVASSTGWAQESAPSDREVPLSELLAFAEQNAPTTRIAIQRRGYGDAAEAGASPWLRANPSFEFGIGPRFDGATDRDFDFYASLAQPVEIAGERGLRLETASRLGARLDAETTVTRWEVRRDVILAYRSAVVARERAIVNDRLVRFADEMRTITRRRFTAGDATAIDVRVADTDFAHAQQAKISAEQELRTARIRLAEFTGWPIDTPPDVVAGLEAPRPVPALADVMRIAADSHPELRARHAAVAEANARAELADREAWPSPVLGVQFTREGSAGSPANYIVLGTVGVPIPFWQLNQGERARARVDEGVARAEESATARALRSRIARAHAELSSASERLALFTSSVSPSLEDSLALLRRGFDAGELPLLTIAVARERFLQAQRDALVAYADYYRALAEMESALGSELPSATSAP